MALEEKEFVDLLSSKIPAGEAALFLGAGVSSSAGYPAWKELLRPCAEALSLQLTDETDLYMLAQYYSNAFGNSELKRIINEEINKLNYESKLINQLLHLNFKRIWTTNFDNVLERNFQVQGILSNTISTDHDLANINPKNRVNIYKLNGDISRLDEIVITQDDIEKYSQSHKMLMTFFKRELVSHTFLFLGYSFKDTIVLSCLSELAECLGNSSHFHYTIMKKEKNSSFPRFISDIEKRYHVKTLLVDNYQDIPRVLLSLNKRIQQKRIFISGSYDSLPPEEEEFADQLCKSLSQKLLENGFQINTGMGQKLGNAFMGYAMQYYYKKQMPGGAEDYVRFFPFPSKMKKADKGKARVQHIQECSTVIFLYGQSNAATGISPGVSDEFQIAKTKKKMIVPIAVTGYKSREILDEIKRDRRKTYDYLTPFVDELSSERNPEKVADIVLKILHSKTDS